MLSRRKIAFTVTALALLTVAALPAPARAAELRLSYKAMEKLLVRGAFKSEGRLYVQGSPRSKCAFSYLHNPRVSAAGQELQIRMGFTTELGVPVGESCVGAGDKFDVVAAGTPVYRDGEIKLANFRLMTLERGYGDALEGMVRDVLAPRLTFPLREQIELSAAVLRQEADVEFLVPELDIPKIRLERQRLVMPFDFVVVMN